MKAYVVDVNVAIVANAKNTHASMECIQSCIEALSEIHQRGIIVLDDAMLILKEYMDYLNIGGDPGVGDFFMKWVWENQGVTSCCELVQLTSVNSSDTDFREYPSDPELAGFDRSDRKYVAAALASLKNPTVLNAVDTDWHIHRVALARNGVVTRFLCPHHMQ